MGRIVFRCLICSFEHAFGMRLSQKKCHKNLISPRVLIVGIRAVIRRKKKEIEEEEI